MDKLSKYHELNSLYKKLAEELKVIQDLETAKKREIYEVKKQISDLSKNVVKKEVIYF